MTDTQGQGLLIALSNPVAGREDEFNEWYTNEHIPEIIALPGFVSAQRYELTGIEVMSPYKYATIYRTEGAAADAQALIFSTPLGSSTSIEQGGIFSAFASLGAPITKDGK